MELSKRAVAYVVVFALVIGSEIGCKSTPPPPPPVVGQQPPPPPPPVPCPTTGTISEKCKTAIPADTPVTVSGGSIHVDVLPAFKASDLGNNAKFTVTGNNIGWLLFDGIDQFPSSQQFSGWVLSISNRDKTNKEKVEAIRICSEATCDGKSLDPNNTIYIKVRSGAWMSMPDNTHLIFHDSECDGSSSNASPGENRQCDFLMNLRLKSHDLNQDMVGKCTSGGTDGVCKVGIGKP